MTLGKAPVFRGGIALLWRAEVGRSLNFLIAPISSYRFF
jgi:hypothetical protein